MIRVGKDLKAHLIPMTRAETPCLTTKKPRKAPEFLASPKRVLESSKSSQQTLKKISEGLQSCCPWKVLGERKSGESEEAPWCSWGIWEPAAKIFRIFRSILSWEEGNNFLVQRRSPKIQYLYFLGFPSPAPWRSRC